MTPDRLRKQLEQEMVEAMVDLLGAGNVSSYYEFAASEFVGLAEWYAEAVARATSEAS